LQHIFNTLINSYIDNKVGIAENFLDESLADRLTENLITLHGDRSLRPAGTGNEAVALQDVAVRRDKIYWLDRSHNDPAEDTFFDLMDRFVSYLNMTCYTGITNYEFHYTIYEEGSFYKKHRDQFRNDDSRQYSMVMYLNADWKETDGGELCIHHTEGLQHISPTLGKSVFFKSSELEHEVLQTTKPRMSITGWLKTG
jgi:SM-20-related protein